MTFLEAYAAGASLTIELTGYPESRRRITGLLHNDDEALILVYDGQEDDPWASRPPTCIDAPFPIDGPPWVTSHHTIREILT